MTLRILERRLCLGAFARRLTLAIAMVAGFAAYAQGGSSYFYPGNLVVSRSVYDNNSSNVRVGEMLPPNCDTTMPVIPPPVCVSATYDGKYLCVANCRFWGNQ